MLSHHPQHSSGRVYTASVDEEPGKHLNVKMLGMADTFNQMTQETRLSRAFTSKMLILNTNIP